MFGNSEGRRTPLHSMQRTVILLSIRTGSATQCWHNCLFRSIHLLRSNPLITGLKEIPEHSRRPCMPYTLPSWTRQMTYKSFCSICHIFYSIRIVVHKLTLICIDRPMFGEDSTKRQITGSYIRKQTFILKMLPVIVASVIFMCLLSFKHRRI